MNYRRAAEFLLLMMYRAGMLKERIKYDRPKDLVLRRVWDSMERRGLDPRNLADWRKLEKE